MSKLIRLLTPEQHREILEQYNNNVDAADAYTVRIKRPVSRQLVRYWRKIYSSKSQTAANHELRRELRFVEPQPDDDLGSTDFIPVEAECILVIPDLHAPYQHPDALDFLKYIKSWYDPDLVVNLGDEQDKHAMSFHDSDPNLDSAGTELEQARVFLNELHELFPQMLLCHSNHGSMLYRKAKAHGIPVQMIKKYRDIIFPDHGAPEWSWAFAWRIPTARGVVHFKHQASGDPLQDAAHNSCNLVTGHEHGNFDIKYAASSARLYWAVRSGCLIDKDSLAFAYGKHTRYKPILGCTVIINGEPQLIPMILGEDGRWVRRKP